MIDTVKRKRTLCRYQTIPSQMNLQLRILHVVFKTEIRQIFYYLRVCDLALISTVAQNCTGLNIRGEYKFRQLDTKRLFCDVTCWSLAAP